MVTLDFFLNSWRRFENRSDSRGAIILHRQVGPEVSKTSKMSTISSSLLYQIPSNAALKAQYVGQKLEDIQAPAAIIDLAVVKKNCQLMLKAAESLNVQFRAHVKTHKVGFDNHGI